MRPRHAVHSVLLVLALAACGGGGTTDPDDNPQPVVTGVTPVSVASGAAGFTLTVDGSGFGDFSTVKWNGNSRPTTVVSAARLTATITAQDVAVAGTANVAVVNAGPGGGTSATHTVTITAGSDGAQIGPDGGTATVSGVTITVPAGAVASQITITATSVASPPQHPDLIAGTAWELGPSPRTFAQPVTVSIGYPATLPGGVNEADLVVHRWNGTAWQPLANTTVNAAANTASGTTTQFSIFAVIAVSSSVRVWTRVTGHPLETWGTELMGWTEALGRTWIVTGDNPPMIRSTTDGITWTSLDPTSVGLPARPGCSGSPGSCWSYGHLAVAGTTTELLITTMLRHADGSFVNAAGHYGEIWAIRGNGQDWTVQGPTTSGLNQYTPPPSARNFRVTGMARGAGWGDRFIAVGLAQYWLPFSTSDQSFLSFTTSANAGWQMHVSPDAAPNPARIVQDMVGSPLGFFAVGRLNSDFQLWHTSNGTDWTERIHPASQVAAHSNVEHSVILYGPSGLVVARRGADSRIRTWHSVNGTTWTQSQVTEVSSGSTRGLVAAGNYILHAINDDMVWISSDGQTWQAVANSPAFRQIIAVGNKLFGITLLGAVWELTL